MLREEAESRMLVGGGFTDEFAPVLRMRNAESPENEKSLVQAHIRATLAFPQASSQTRRLFGPRGRAARQDVLVAANLDAA